VGLASTGRRLGASARKALSAAVWVFVAAAAITGVFGLVASTVGGGVNAASKVR
jgi:hypothetical protein